MMAARRIIALIVLVATSSVAEARFGMGKSSPELWWLAAVTGTLGLLFPDLFGWGGLEERGVTRWLSAALFAYGSVMLMSYHWHVF